MRIPSRIIVNVAIVNNYCTQEKMLFKTDVNLKDAKLYFICCMIEDLIKTSFLVINGKDATFFLIGIIK